MIGIDPNPNFLRLFLISANGLMASTTGGGGVCIVRASKARSWKCPIGGSGNPLANRRKDMSWLHVVRIFIEYDTP